MLKNKIAELMRMLTGTGGNGSNSGNANNNTATLSPTTQTVSPNQRIDFNGRNFGHEETVNITRNGTVVGTAHADGGGNFSTGSLTIPDTAGVYTYTFAGGTSGIQTTSTITVQNR